MGTALILAEKEKKKEKKIFLHFRGIEDKDFFFVSATLLHQSEWVG